MNPFFGAVSLPNNSPRTLQELIQAAVTARTYDTQAQEDADVNRYGGAVGMPITCIRPEVDVYIMTPYKGAHVAADFTGGGGAILKANVDKYFTDGIPGNLMFFQASGNAVTLHLT